MKRSLLRNFFSLMIFEGFDFLAFHLLPRETRDFERSHLSPFAKDRLFGSPFRLRVSREAERKMPATQALPAKRPSFFACSITRTEAFGNCCPHCNAFLRIAVFRRTNRKFAVFTKNRPFFPNARPTGGASGRALRPSSLFSGNSGHRTVSFEPMRKRSSP